MVIGRSGQLSGQIRSSLLLAAALLVRVAREAALIDARAGILNVEGPRILISSALMREQWTSPLRP